jgi:nitroreductase
MKHDLGVQPAEPSIFETRPEKLADTSPRVHDLIRSRWSPRSFTDREISNEDLKTVLEAARWAASSFNEQPWRFLVAQKSDSAAFNKLLDLLVPFNQAWVKKASVLIIMAARKTFSQNATENYYALHDCGAACAHILLQATALGFQGHGMAGFDRVRAQRELNIPEGFVPAAAIALGYVGSPDDLQLDERYKQAERGKRVRKPLTDLAFGVSWEEPLAL